MMKKSTSIKTLTRRAAMTLLSMFMLTASTAWAQDAIGGIEYNADGGYYVIDEPDSTAQATPSAASASTAAAMPPLTSTKASSAR